MIRISELGREGDGSFRVRVSLGDHAAHDVALIDPAQARDEDLLAWYFEEHLKYPFLDKEMEQTAVTAIADYGGALFAQVLGGAAGVDYARVRDRGFGEARIEISGSAALHKLHWEALRDPGLPRPLGTQVPVIRYVEGQPATVRPPGGSPSLNVLVVTARPAGPRDVGYRTVSRPLFEAVQAARLPVTVDLVRPGTWEALVSHLRQVTEDRGPGWYQVVHFDLHGGFEDYAALLTERQAARLDFVTPLAPFEGRQGVVFFESDTAGKARLVTAGQLAGLLTSHRVQVAVLNACQSSMQSASEAGLAQRLAEAGVPAAIGMAYSVTVSATERAMPVLYKNIAAGVELAAAVTAARQELFDHQSRDVYFDRQLDLADWMLPVMFSGQPLHLGLSPMSESERVTFTERAAAVGDEPAPQYGFIGRDLDISAIEHRILADPASNELVIQGMAGAGKSSLLTHLAWWWQRTGLVDQVFRFSYEDRAWTAGDIVRTVCSQMSSPGDDAGPDTADEAAQIARFTELLHGTRHLLILDNTESITATPGAIPHALRPADQLRLNMLLSRLRGARTLVLVGSRENEPWLGTGVDGPEVYALSGLDSQAASVLVDRVLTRQGAAGYLSDAVERDSLARLVDLLGGYPLPLTAVLSVLSTLKPSTALAELQAGGVAPDPAGLIGRTIEYSFNKLDPAIQASLLLFAPFTAVVPYGSTLYGYQLLLRQQDIIRDLGNIDLVAAMDQAIRVGLAAPHPEINDLVQLQPVLPWFLRNRMRDRPALMAAAAQAHYEHYIRLADAIRQMQRSTGKPEEQFHGQATVRAEYANLTTALTHALRTGQPFDNIPLALVEYLTDTHQRDACRQLIDAAIADHPEPQNYDQHWDLATLRGLAGGIAIDQGRLDDAETHYQHELRLRLSINDRAGECIVYQRLGNIAQEHRRWDDADASYRKALAIKLELGDRHGAAVTYACLGTAAQEQGRYDEAEKSFGQALAIYHEFGDSRATASCYNNLAIIAQRQRRYAEAGANYKRALRIKLEYRDLLSAATTLHNLGALAEAQGQYDDAEASYREALAIRLQMGDHEAAADTLTSLGVAAHYAQQPAKATSIFQQALDIYLDIGDQHGLARTYGRLGWVAQHQERFQDAQVAYHKALSIYKSLGDPDAIASTHQMLGQVAEAEQNYDEARDNYRQALEIWQESDPRLACSAAFPFGAFLAKLGEHRNAVHALIYAAVTWRKESGNWDHRILALLHEEGVLLPDGEFASVISSEVPATLAAEFRAAMKHASRAADRGRKDPPTSG